MDLEMNGAQGRNRTTDTMIFSHVLYQLSYLGTGERGLALVWSGLVDRRGPSGAAISSDAGL